ncbi:exonuclease SbcCD subunit D [Vibrio sp. ZSDZ34]|jgi:exonuclease SbcD|uniref:Nuclease SbcCD subunit D n=1 Tax=Vibrio gelatinilyticus TaxID=2893468 RepID=A0A9X1W9S6_9VIBR|nr:exonuclease SbcCD subunit D [Vibrio gelatinilyticus]MCJ2376366.1 exonuclease SbcCD subunit D [Vibrio gelatinilyticus]
MKFIHTSDWHLGRQFHNVSLLDDQKAVLEQIKAYLIEHQAAALVIAGDIYDRSIPPTPAIEVLDAFLSDVINNLKTPVILIPGNHDGATRLGFGASQLNKSGLHIISTYDEMLNPVVLSSPTIGEVAFYGIPYSDPEQVRHHYQTQVSNHEEAHQFLSVQLQRVRGQADKEVLISHCFIDGAEPSESERTLSIGGADRVSFQHFSDFDYVALGHLHQPQYRGKEHIRYCGSIMKYSFSEQYHNKAVTLVELDEEGVQSTQLPLKAPHDMRVVEGYLQDILEQGKSDVNAHDYLMVRLLDQHAILDPMEKLRKVYPNTLHLEKPGMLVDSERGTSSTRLARDEVDMFKDFFNEIQGQPLSDEQTSMVQTVIAELRKAEREG